MYDDLIERWRTRAEVPFTVDQSSLSSARAADEGEETEPAVRALAGLGGFLASLVFLLFLWLTDVLERPVVALSLGGTLLVITLWLGRRPRQAFLATTTVCGYLLGAGLMMIGLPPGIPDELLILPVPGLAVLTLIFTRQYYLVALATVSFPACLLYLHLVDRSGAWVWLAVVLSAAALVAVTFFEHRFIHDRRLAPLRTGVVFGLLMSLLWFRWGQWMVPSSGGLSYASVPFAGCFLLLVLSFRNRHFFGVASGVAGLAYFTAQYYYDLRWTLLGKSLTLMAVGTLFLVAYFLLRHKFSAREKA
ncbi:DUF4401 domain-containing protein [Neolewinella litorea]|uniref:DUF4401 domain-containing protein n=1 Tax=Neolewinella litorea TaxID=2562452 RepID=UPI001455F9C1|nr:DUF4401 domain-containing protein [Neolewinella litorea]